MRNIIIIGNGFDLSHDIPTGYSSFIENLVLTELNISDSNLLNKFKQRPLGEMVNRASNSRTVRYDDSNKKNYVFTTNNYFLADLLEEKTKNENDWSDIESFYYTTLLDTDEDNLIKLQEDFMIIKQKLILYLKSLKNTPDPNINFDEFFGHKYFSNGSKENNLILNFNYTKTLNKLYGDKIKNFQIQNVHGDLSSSDNDTIVFGYDITNEKFNEFLNEGKKQIFFKNIKSEIYKVYSTFELLKSFLSKNKNFNLFVIGHSCSISDSQMLQRIFKDDSLNRVKLIYYKSVDNYKKQRFNIDKIMTNTGHNIDGKISGVNALTKLPQFDDNETTKSLNNSKIDEMLNSDSLRNNIGEYHIY